MTASTLDSCMKLKVENKLENDNDDKNLGRDYLWKHLLKEYVWKQNVLEDPSLSRNDVVAFHR